MLGPPSLTAIQLGAGRQTVTAAPQVVPNLRRESLLQQITEVATELEATCRAPVTPENQRAVAAVASNLARLREALSGEPQMLLLHASDGLSAIDGASTTSSGTNVFRGLPPIVQLTSEQSAR